MTAGWEAVVPVLAGQGVRLRAHANSDLAAIVEQSLDPGSQEYTRVPLEYGEQQAREFLDHVRGQWEDPAGNRLWAIEAAGRFAGSIDLRPRGDGHVEVGFGLHPAARGHGTMAAALRLACTHAFQHLGATSVLWKAMVGNWPSRRVAWACGFTHHGTVRDLLPGRDGAAHDAWVATLAKGEPMAPRTVWWDTPVLERDRVRLRAWGPQDASAPGWVPDVRMARFMPGLMPTADQYAAWLLSRQERAASGSGVTWCVADRASNEPLGSVEIFRLDVPLLAGSGMVGYWLYEHARGRGAMDDALRLVLDHAFAGRDDGGLGLHRLVAGTDIDNRASTRLLLRHGFRPVGIERHSMARHDGEHVDGPRFELLAAERGSAVIRSLRVETVELDGIRLRAWREEDRPAVDWVADPAAHRWLPSAAQPTHETFPDWLRMRQWRVDTGVAVQWAIADQVTDEVLGNVSLHHIGVPDDGNVELGYWLYPRARGRGWVDQAVGFAVAHAFAPVAEGGLGQRRLCAYADADNRASRQVLLRNGFREVGVATQVYSPADGPAPGLSAHNQATFELLAHDDREARSAAYRAGRVAPVIIEGEGLRLRPFREADVPRIAAACSDERTQRYLETLPAPYTEADARAFLVHAAAQADDGEAVHWCVADAATDELLGSVGLRRLARGRRDTAEVGYWVHPDARARGVMTMACRLALRHASVPWEDGGLGRRRVTLRTRVDNPASRRVAEAAGMQLAGVERAATVGRDGRRYDMAWYDVLAEEVLVEPAACDVAAPGPPVAAPTTG